MGIYYFLLWIGVIGTFLSQDSRLKRTGFYIIFIYIPSFFDFVFFLSIMIITMTIILNIKILTETTNAARGEVFSMI